MDASASSSTWPLPFVAKGESAELFDAGDGYVLKLFRDSVSDDMIAREMEASAHAWACGVPAAAAIARDDRAGRRGILYPRLDGDPLSTWIRRRPLQAGRALDEMARIQAAMHEKAGGTLRSLKAVLATDILYGPAPQNVQAAALCYLDRLPDGEALVHGDFHLDNVMMTQRGMMVIDWSKAAAGHPAADAVRSEMLMRFGVGPTDPMTNLWRDWAARRLMKSYLRASATTSDMLAHWRPVVALAWLRARRAGRTPAFIRYLNSALASANLPRIQ